MRDRLRRDVIKSYVILTETFEGIVSSSMPVSIDMQAWFSSFLAHF